MKRAWLWISLSIIVLAAAGAAIWFFYRPLAAETTCTGATVYTAANYGGDSACFPVGSHSKSDLLALGIGNDSISSIKVDAGFKVTGYFDDLQQGTSLEFTTDIKNLDDVIITEIDFPSGINPITWNGKISSIKVETAPSCSVAVYLGADSGGMGACLPVGEYNAAALSTKGITNDQISSLKIKSGFKITAYRDNDFKGDSEEFTADILNLNSVVILADSSQVWNDKISSIKVETAPACAVAVYDNANFGYYGACLAVGDYTKAALEAKHVFDNTIASIKVNAGFKATVYVNDNYLGNSFDFTANAVNLDNVPGGGESRWDDKISSIKVTAASTPTPTNTVSLTANGQEAVTVASGASVALAWTITNFSANLCMATPYNWFPTSPERTGTATVKPTATTTYKLTCGDISDQVVVTVSGSVTTPPTVTTQAATNITATSATLHGTVVSVGSNPSSPREFILGTTPGCINGYGAGNSTGIGPYELNWPQSIASLSPLTPNTTYYFEAAVDNGVGDTGVYPYNWNTGECLSFKTLAATTTCTAPLTATRTQTCPTGQTGTFIQTRTKGAAPTCAWGDWKDADHTCVNNTPTPTPTPTATTTTPTTTPTATATTTGTAATSGTTRPASTGPETPLVATGLLSLTLGAFYLVKRYLG